MKIEDYEWFEKLPATWEIEECTLNHNQVMYCRFNTQVAGCIVTYAKPNFFLYVNDSMRFVRVLYVKEIKKFVFSQPPVPNSSWFDVWPESRNFKRIGVGYE